MQKESRISRSESLFYDFRRKEGDSNPRIPLEDYTLSRRASSATPASFQCGTKIEIILNERVYSRGFLIANRCVLEISGWWMKFLRLFACASIDNPGIRTIRILTSYLCRTLLEVSLISSIHIR